jgi:nicotinamide mononucleotide transporter
MLLEIIPFSELFDTFIEHAKNTTWLEIIAVVFGIASVLFARAENILVYPTGIISVLIYVYILVQPEVKLYADAGINIFYFFMSVYGWFMWTRKNEHKEELKISMNSKKDWMVSGIGLIISFFIIILLLNWLKSGDVEYWSTNLPYIDSFTTAIFIVGMLLMAFKKVENWTFWIIGDLISVPLYFYKGLVFSSFQFLVFLILAVMGYIEWRRKYLSTKNAI